MYQCTLTAASLEIVKEVLWYNGQYTDNRLTFVLQIKVKSEYKLSGPAGRSLSHAVSVA